MRANVATWKRPLIWALGDDPKANFLQWIVVAVLAGALIGWGISTFISANIPSVRSFTREWTLPTWLARDFAWVTDLNTQIIVRPIDPAKTRLTVNEEDIARLAATKRDHFLFAYLNQEDSVELNYLLQNPSDTYELHYREIPFRPIKEATSLGGYYPKVSKLDREARKLTVTYEFTASGNILAVVLLGVFVWGFALMMYGALFQPLHRRWVKSESGLHPQSRF